MLGDRKGICCSNLQMFSQCSLEYYQKIGRLNKLQKIPVEDVWHWIRNMRLIYCCGIKRHKVACLSVQNMTIAGFRKKFCTYKSTYFLQFKSSN